MDSNEYVQWELCNIKLVAVFIESKENANKAPHFYYIFELRVWAAQITLTWSKLTQTHTHTQTHYMFPIHVNGFHSFGNISICFMSASIC